MAAKKPVEVDVFELALKTLGDVWADRVDKKVEAQLFSELSTVDGLQDYLRATMSDDVKRYYMASTDTERENVRGAMMRTMYWRSLLRKSNPKKKITAPKAKLKGMRYES